MSWKGGRLEERGGREEGGRRGSTREDKGRSKGAGREEAGRREEGGRRYTRE